MFSTGNRPPSKSKGPRPPELPKYPLSGDPTASRMRKKDAKSIVFNQETHQRLNDLYKKFLQSNKEQSPSRESSATSFNSQQQQRLVGSPTSIQYVETIPSHKDEHVLDYIHEDYAARLAKTSSNSYKDRIYESKLEREKSISNHPSEMSEVQIERMKTKFQRVLFEQFGVSEEAMLGQMNSIYDKTVRLEVKVSRLVGYLTTTTNRLDQMRYRTSENDILRELNKEYELKIRSLEQERKALKEEKELEGMKDMVTRMRQTNSVRQERGTTPARDKVAETQKKLLIKENLELKKARETLDKDINNLKEENDKLRESFAELSQYCKQLETGAGVNLDAQKQEMYHKVVQHAEELQKKFDIVQFDVERKQKQIQQLTSALKVSKDALAKRDDQVLQLKLSNKRTSESSLQTDKLKKTIEGHLKQIQSLNTKLTESKKQALNLKRVNEKKQILQKSKIKEIQLLKEENEKIRKQLAETIKARQTEVNKQPTKNVVATNKQEDKRLRREADELRQQLLNSKGELMKLRSSNTQLQQKIVELQSEIQSLRNFLIQKEKQVAKNKEANQQSLANSVAADKIAKILTSVLQLQAPSVKQLPGELASIIQQLFQKLRSVCSKLSDAETELKKLSLHKNKLDHVLHQDQQQRVQYNDFETTHQDAYFFRQKPKTDANLRQQLKRVAKKLDVELEDNIKNRSEISRLKNKIQELQTNRKLASEALLDVLREEEDRKLREEQLTVLLSVLELTDEKSWVRQRLLAR